MTNDGYPPVYVVDTSATRPPVPPRPNQGRQPQRQRGGVVQTLLIMLVCVALCGMAIEACFIYRLYQPDSDPDSGSSASFEKQIGGEDVPAQMKRPSRFILPSKPVAHLTDGQDVVHGSKIMAWSMDAEPLLYEMEYKDKCLMIQKEGFYFVYSKISFSAINAFQHSIELRTKLYFGDSIPLLSSRKYSEPSHKFRQSNSYLGGVFHLQRDDAIFVKVSNTSKVLRQKSYENVFGAYMI